MQNFFFIKIDKRLVRIIIDDLLYVESNGNFVKLVTRHKTCEAIYSLKQFEAKLPAAWFSRIHRSYIVGISHIDSFDKTTINIGNVSLPIAHNYYKLFISKVIVFDEIKQENTEKPVTVN